MPAKSTTDAVLYLAHDIHAANNHNLYTSLITFDTTGYFNNVNHNRLLAVLRDKGIPLPICRWVQSFVISRATRIRVDGYTDSMGRSEQTEDQHEQGGLHMFHMPTQEDPPNPSSNPTRVNHSEPTSPNHISNG